MDTDKIARGGGPENSAYDKARHEKMRLRPLSRFYGIEKEFMKGIQVCPGTCEKCVFDIGKHICGR